VHKDFEPLLRSFSNHIPEPYHAIPCSHKPFCSFQIATDSHHSLSYMSAICM
jgi:hypothetical protein